MYLSKGYLEITAHGCEVMGCRHIPLSNQYVVPARATVSRQNEPGEFAQSALRAAPGHGISDLLRTGEPHPDGFRLIGDGALTGLKVKARRGVPQAMGGTHKVGPLSKNLKTRKNRRLPVRSMGGIAVCVGHWRCHRTQSG